jgi:adenylate kinase
MKELRAGRMAELRAKGIAATPHNVSYPVPRFFVCILHVSEHKSVERQQQRWLEAREHNARVVESGFGEKYVVRDTDRDVDKARERYRIFVKHRNTLSKLKEYFTYSEIDASGDIKLVEREILNQFQYQSRQDLSKRAFDAIQPILLASRIGMNARPSLVRRIEEVSICKPLSGLLVSK